MKRFRWSSLYPSAWRREFGEEFDAMLKMSGVTPRSAADIVWEAMKVRCSFAAFGLSMSAAWILVGWLNAYAHEVQWPAGALVVTSFAFTIWRPKRWLLNALMVFSSIPVSSLCTYQIPGIHHAPLYQTSVALIPAIVGACLGLAICAGYGSGTIRKAQ